MTTSFRKRRAFGLALLILFGAILGLNLRITGVVGVVVLVVIARYFGKFEGQLTAAGFTILGLVLAVTRQPQLTAGGELLQGVVCIVCAWIAVAITTEQNLSEDSIRRREVYLAEAQRLTHTGSLIWDASTREAVYASDEWYRLYEIEPEKGAPSWEQRLHRLHPEDRTGWQAAIERAIREKSDYELDTRLLLRSGTIRHVHTIGHAVLNASGELVEFIVTVMDITCRKQVEEALRQSERELREVIDTIPTMVWIALPDGSNVFVSKRWTEYTGVSATGFSWQIAVHSDDLERNMEAFRRCWAEGLPVEDEVRFRRADGEFRWFSVAAEPFRDQQGKILKWYGIITEIEDRKRAEEKLRAAEQEARELLERIPAMVSIRTTAGIAYTNERIHKYIGVGHEELRGRGWLRFIHPEDQQRILESQTRSTKGIAPMDDVYRLRGADGTYRWFRTISEPYPSKDGPLFYSVATEIDELYRSRELLREQELQLNLLTENLPAVVFKAAPDGTIVYVNQKEIEYSGRTAEDLQQNGWIDLVHPDDLEETLGHWNRMLAGSDGYDTVHRLMCADGQYRWFHTRVAAIRNDSGETIAFHGVMLDTTAQKNAELALQQSEQQMHRMMDTVPSILYSSAPDGSVTFVNKKARDYVGMTLDQIHGWGWVEIIHPEEREYVIKEYKNAIASGRSFAVERRTRRADGIYRWHLSRAEPLRDEDGQILQWFGVEIDIDERKRAEDHLRETRVKLARASRIATVAELSASIAHELNQPLTSVMASAKAARRWLSSTPPNFSEAVTSIERVLRDGRAADERMQQIRGLFKQQPFQKKEVRLAEMIIEALRLVREDANQREILIDVQVADHLPPILVEPIQIQEVLINLISNGIEAMENNIRPPHLSITATPVDGRSVLIEVIDNGPGLKDFESIFDAFVTTKEKGMGVGLAVSRSIIEAHSGQIWAENNPDYGAKFSIEIPVANPLSDNKD